MEKELHPETKAFILQKECDSINNHGFDTDLSLYYELFKNGSKEKAKQLYRDSLQKKYPYEEKRVELMRCYRTKDPRFPFVYTDAINELAERLAERIAVHIDGIIECFSTVGSNPMSMLKAIQQVLRQFFPPGQDAAYDMIERLEAHASAMDYRVREFLTAADLLKGYLDNSIFKSDEELKAAREKQEKEIERSIEKRDRRRAERSRNTRKRYVIDLRKVQFSRDDLAEIRIDSRLKRKAHQVLAFCRLYWLKINDPDFERKIFLYSKKYNTKHYDIFRTIKEGRLRALPDDVLLLEVFNHLSRGYEYNISEDLYMRKAWQRIKPVPVSAPAGVVRRGPGTADSGSSGKASAAGRVRETASAGRGAPPKEEQAKPVSVTAGSGGPSGKKPPAEDRKKPPVRKREPRVGPPPSEKPPEQQKQKRAEAPVESLQQKVDKLKSGPFKNYHRLFRTKLVSFIEEYLIRDAVTFASVKLEEKGLEEAKNVIYRFIMAHYGKNNFDWSRSSERKQVEKLGFLVPELYTITSRCCNFVKDASLSEEYKRMARS